MRSSDLVGARLLVLGTGREIGAFAAAVAPVVASIVAVDARDGESASRWRESWGDRAPLTIAPDTAAFVGRVDVAVTSPGIPPHDPLRTTLVAGGIPVSMPPDLWIGDHGPVTTAVTGSKGKSTTASLVAALARAHGLDAQLGGNIGVPLYSLPPADRYVAEISSYQASSLTTAPDVAVVTSLFPEHLDWHGSAEAYFDAKLNLLALGPRLAVINGEDPVLAAELRRRGLGGEPVGPGERWALDPEGVIRRDGRAFVPTDGWALRGRHNALNAAIALAALEAGGIDPDPEVAEAALRSFRPLEHRLDPIEDPSGLLFVDDSLSTAPQAAVRALESFEGRDVVLLLGGHDRGVDLGPLADRLARTPVAALVGLPGSGERMLRELSAAPGIPSEVATDMTDAVRRARRLAPAGAVVLLSPAAPSYGRYADYRERAADFRRAIAETVPREP